MFFWHEMKNEIFDERKNKGVDQNLTRWMERKKNRV